MNTWKQLLLIGLIGTLSASMAMGQARVVDPPGGVLRGKNKEKIKPVTGLDTENNTAGRGIGGPSLELLTAAEEAFETVDSQLKAVFNETPEMRSAAEALHTAQQRLNSAYADVMKKLSADPAYVSANEKRTAAQTKLEHLRANADRVAASDITAAAAEVMNHGTVITRMQAAALRNDAMHTEAKKALAEASAKVSEMQKKLGEALAANPDWVAKKKALDDARAKLTARKTAPQ